MTGDSGDMQLPTSKPQGPLKANLLLAPLPFSAKVVRKTSGAFSPRRAPFFPANLTFRWHLYPRVQ